MNEAHAPESSSASKFAPLYDITRETFTEAFSATNLALLAELKHTDPGRFHDLRDKWRKEKFPGQGDLTRRIDERVKHAVNQASAKQHVRQIEELKARAEETGAVVVDASDNRAIARLFRDNVRPNLIFNNGTWLDFRHNRYVEVEDKHVRADLWAFVEKAIDSTYMTRIKPTPNKVSAVVDALNGLCFRERQAFTPPTWLDRREGDPPADEMLACQNGLLHISTQELLDLTPRFFTYNGLPFEYEDPVLDPGPRAWLEFLNNLWPDSPQSIEALQEIFGYLLTADTRQQKIFLIVGPPRSGKGTIGRVLTSLLGKENCTSPSLKALGSNFGMESLVAKQLMLVSDMRLSRNSDTGEITGNLLRISGEDDVNVSRKYRDDWRGKLSTRIMLLSNIPLIMPDMSGALINRVIPLVLKKSFLGAEDTTLTDRLLLELPSILNWSIEGWKRLRERGHFVLTPEGAELNSYAASQASPVQAFVDECCELDPNARIGKRRLFEAFEGWSEQEEVFRVHTEASFGRELRVASGYRITTTRPRNDSGRQIPHYAGIRLKDAYAHLNIPDFDDDL